MSSPMFKSGLTPSNNAIAEKAKILRKPTPDSDAIASSDDEHAPTSRQAPPIRTPSGRRPSSGWLQDIQPNRKYSQDFQPSRKNSLPPVSLGAAVSLQAPPGLDLPVTSRPLTSSLAWNTTSFTSPTSAQLKDVVPSPTTRKQSLTERPPISFLNEDEDGVAFLPNQNPLRKPGRSQSYSIGHAELDSSPIAQFTARHRGPLRHRPSKPSLLGESLSQLREDEGDELGVGAGANGDNNGSFPSGSLMQGAEANAVSSRHLSLAGLQSPLDSLAAAHKAVLEASIDREREVAIEEPDDQESQYNMNMPLGRRFSEFNALGARGYLGRSSNLESRSSSNLWGDSMARRHSFATPSAHQTMYMPPAMTYNEEEEDETSPLQESPPPEEPFDAGAYFSGLGPASRAINASAVSAAHPDPVIPRPSSGSLAAYPTPGPQGIGRPQRQFHVVTFKCSRADVYFTYADTGLELRPGDLVVTEGDRGHDLGQVSHANVPLDEARRLKAEALDEHFRWLCMFSQYSLAGSKEHNMLGALARAKGYPNIRRESLTSMGGQQDNDNKPKMIKRLAQHHEIQRLRDKEGLEAKAKRLGAQKAVEHKLPMEILDAEFQADYHKLTYFYYAEAYVNFNPLIVDIFKQYKIRIWMSAVNPASVVNPAGLMQIQPPSAIGPGAILPPRSNAPAAAVGPGFGHSNYRQNDRPRARGTPNTSQAQFDPNYHAWANGLGGYPQAQFGSQPYGTYAGNQEYGRQQMQYAGYWPEVTYSSSPAFGQPVSGPAFRGGYPGPMGSGAGGGYGGGYGGVSGAGNGYGAGGFTGLQNPNYPSAGAASSGWEPDMPASMGNLSLGGNGGEK